MFERKRNGKREQFKEENKIIKNIVPNSKELKAQFEDAIRHKTAICPVTFVSDEKSYIKNNGLTDYPLNYQALISSVIMKNPEISLGQIANLPDPYGAFFEFDSNYTTIARDNLEFHILQSVFTNFCNKINYSSLNGLVFLQYIPLSQFVYEEFNSMHKYGLGRIVPWDMIHGKNKLNTQEVKSVEQIDSYMMYLKNVAMHTSIQIASLICIACDKAINDVVLQVHCIPNIDQIYDCISTQNEVLRNKFKNHDSDFPAYAAIYVKEIVRKLISELIEDNILDMVFKALVSLTLTGYDIYGNYAIENGIFKNRRSEDDF